MKDRCLEFLRKCFTPFPRIVRLLASKPRDGGLPAERVIVRLGVPILLGISVYLAVRTADDVSDAPKIAFGNHLVFVAQLVLLIFYAILLLVVPLVRAVASGQLPIELTLKGPRYPEALSSASDELRGRVEAIERLAEAREQERKRDDRTTAEGLKANADALEEIAERVEAIDVEIGDQRELTAQGIEALAYEIQDLKNED